MAFGPVNAGGGVSGPTLEGINGRIQAAQSAAQSAAEAALQAHKTEQGSHNFADLTGSVFHAGTTAPANKGLLWIDTTASTGGLKYFNGTAWVHVPVSTT